MKRPVHGESRWQSPHMKVRDKSHESRQPDLCRGLSWLVADFVAKSA